MASKTNNSNVFNNLLFPRIFQTFRISIQPTKLIISFLALAVICLAGWLMDFSNSVVTAKNGETELNIHLQAPQQIEKFVESYKKIGERQGVFSTLWNFAALKFHNAINALFAFNLPAVAVNIAEYLKAVGWAWKYHTVYCLIFITIKLLVISLAGGSICRLAALQFARGEKPGFTESLHFSTKKFASFITAPILPVGIIIVIGILLFILGLLGNISYVGELLIALFIIPVLLAGIAIAILLIGTIVGFNLMFPAIAYEGSDGFDAISRSFRYVFSKPWHMGIYTAIAAVYGVICYLFVRLLAFLVLCSSYWFVSLGISDTKLAAIWPIPTFTNLSGITEPATTNLAQGIAAFVIHLFILVIIGLVVSFITSFYFSANTIIYSLLRKRIDNTSLDEICLPFDEEETVVNEDK